MEQKEVVITHETLFEILKIEKDRSELQKLDDNFFSEVVKYIKDKSKITRANDSLFSYEDKKKTEKQLENIRRILKNLYDKREKKIINLALDKSRTKSDVIDTSALLKEEKKFFDSLVDYFNIYREGILYNLLNENVPIIEEKKEEASKGGFNPEIKKPIEEKNETKNSTKLVRFIHPVPKFVGKDLEEYGPFEEDDMANLPNEIVDVLLLKSRVEEINEG